LLGPAPDCDLAAIRAGAFASRFGLRGRRFSPATCVGEGTYSVPPLTLALAKRRGRPYLTGFEFRPNDLDLPPTVRLTHDLLQNTRTNRLRLSRGLDYAHPRKGFL
jgi:hypothetical protein